MINNLLYSALKIITNIVFITCIIGTAVNIYKCVVKYVKTINKLNSYKKAFITPKDLTSLNKKEYFFWLYKFLDAYDYIDYEYTLSVGDFFSIESNYMIGEKNNLKTFIKVSDTIDTVSLSESRIFLGEMICSGCSVGIIIGKNVFSEEAKEFLNSASANCKITYLNLSQICKLNNCLNEFPTIAV